MPPQNPVRSRAPFSLIVPIAATCLVIFLPAKEPQLASEGTKEKVGKLGENVYQTPTNQLLTPAGITVEMPRRRPQAIALSPDGKLLVASGRSPDLHVVDPASGNVLDKVPFHNSQGPPRGGPGGPGRPGGPGGPGRGGGGENRPDAAAAEGEDKDKEGEEKSDEEKAKESSDEDKAKEEKDKPTGTQVRPDTSAQLSFTGLIFSPDGSKIYLSNVNGDVKVFGVDKGKGKVTALKTIALPEAKAPARKKEIPADLAVSKDGKLLYVVGNLSNKLLEVDIESGKVTRSWNVGIAPLEMVIARGKAYVSNWGGRRPEKGDLVGPAGRGIQVRVDPVRHIASEGSVSVIDLKGAQPTVEIMAELHASALAVTPDERYVAVANASSDTITVIETKTDQVVEKIWTREPSDLFGATPNALAFDEKGKSLMVCNGTQNAVGIIKFDPADRESKLLGLVPVGWFPGGIAYDAGRKQMCVANIKGLGAKRVPRQGDRKPKPEEDGDNSKDSLGALSLVPIPDEATLATYTAIAKVNMRYGAMAEAVAPPRPNQPRRPVPERAGEPSVFKHVLYIIKENRTYDQVLGDVKEGNGNATLCTFGEKFTPNQHKMVREFVLLDNTYCSGIQSADGHQWTDAAITTDYVERGHASWPRSYMSLKTEDGLDALSYSPAGFLWDNALKHNVSIRHYGEGCISQCRWSARLKKKKPRWQDYLKDLETGGSDTIIKCKPGLPTLKDIAKLDTVGWDLGVPDVIRAEKFIQELQEFEQKGNLPQLMIMLLPNDHTQGTNPRKPSPGAMVADNDLAFGRIVEAVSKSKFWPETCIIAIEDDPQAGWDHVSGYRTTAYVVSPYTKRAQTISTQYNQTSVVHTIELILGLPPMNMMDATATPMSDCFTDTPNFTAFESVPNSHPLDEMSPERERRGFRGRRDAAISETLPLDEPDKCPEDVLNRIIWRAMKGEDVPYPEWAVTKVEDDDD